MKSSIFHQTNSKFKNGLDFNYRFCQVFPLSILFLGVTRCNSTSAVINRWQDRLPSYLLRAKTDSRLERKEISTVWSTDTDFLFLPYLPGWDFASDLLPVTGSLTCWSDEQSQHETLQKCCVSALGRESAYHCKFKSLSIEMNLDAL